MICDREIQPVTAYQKQNHSAYLFAERNLTHSVSLHNSVIQLNWLYIACEVVDSFTGDTSVLGDGLNLLGSSNADFLESYRKSYLKAEILDFLDLRALFRGR